MAPPPIHKGDLNYCRVPLFNGDPNAMILVTPRQTTLTVSATDVRVFYNSGWNLCSPSLAPGMTHTILVINQ